MSRVEPSAADGVRAMPLQALGVNAGEIDKAVGAALDQPAHAVAHAENVLDLAACAEARLQALDHARERLIDDRRRPAGLADHRIAGELDLPRHLTP